MRLEKDRLKQTAFPFGIGSKTPRLHSANIVNSALLDSCASGAAKPARDEEEPVKEAIARSTTKFAMASEGSPRTLPDALSMIQGEAIAADARQLLKDIPVLQEWKSVRNPNNKVRDAMLKLGVSWEDTDRGEATSC